MMHMPQQQVFMMIDNKISPDEITYFLLKNEFRSKDLWIQVQSALREVENFLKSQTQTSHTFLSVLSFFKIECMKIKHNLNYFALRQNTIQSQLNCRD